MTDILTIVCLGITFAILIRLTVIDMQVRLLPNVYVFAFLVCGMAFHYITDFRYSDFDTCILGFIGGGGLLMVVREAANNIYGFDTLGLGDVKLIAAGGFWLGNEHIFLAIALGATFGLIHGLIEGQRIKATTGQKPDFSELTIPAGPGFILGLVVVAAFKFLNLSIW